MGKISVKKLDYKKVAIALAIVVLLIVVIVMIVKGSSKKNNELELNEFEKVAVYGYLENNLLDVSTLYMSSGASNYNEIQIFQSKLKQALDTYFASHSESEVASSVVMNLIDSKYVPNNIDFHGIVISDYEYNHEKETFVKSIGANANIAGIEHEINSVDYSNKKASVQKIETTDEENKYKVTFNIVNSMFDNNNVESTGEAIVSLKDGSLVLDSCTIND